MGYFFIMSALIAEDDDTYEYMIICMMIVKSLIDITMQQWMKAFPFLFGTTTELLA